MGSHAVNWPAARRRAELAFLHHRDGGRCDICRQPIDLERRDGTAAAPALYLRVPGAAGGTPTRDNLRVAHRGCIPRRRLLVTAVRHRPLPGRECLCGCQHVAGLLGARIENASTQALALMPEPLLVAEFVVPSVGGRRRHRMVAYSYTEVGLEPPNPTPDGQKTEVTT